MIRLFLFNNVRREEVGQITVDGVSSEKDLSETIMQKFEELGCVIEPGRGRLCIMDKQELIPFDEKMLFSDDISVAYLDIVKLDNAHEFKLNGKRQDKIIYYLWSNERKHFREPHIHARIGKLNDKGCENTRISYMKYKKEKKLVVNGRLKSPSDQREAEEFAEKHIAEIREFWNSIVVPQGGPKWED